MKLSEKQQTFARNVGLLLGWVYSHKDWGVSLGEVHRPRVLQYLYLWAKRSQTLKSKHLDRLAIDLNLFIDGKYITDPEKYRTLGEFWESLHPKNVWGGRFSVKPKDYDTKIGWDSQHFQTF